MKTPLAWVIASFLLITPPAAAQSVQSCETMPGEYVPVGNEYEVRAEPAYINAAEVNIRNGPSTDFDVVGQAIAGAYVDVIGQAFDAECSTWVRVRFPLTESFGWIHSDFVRLTYGRGWWT